MNNDLISREKTIERLIKMGNPYHNFVENNIKHMPVAYNINRVLEQLKDNECIHDNKWTVAEKIIKNGGLN